MTCTSPARGEEPLHFSLKNGLEVLIVPDATAAQSCVLVRYAVGSQDDPVGYRGLAHLTEHMTFRAGDTMRELESLGATEFNGLTAADHTFYYAVVGPEALEGRTIPSGHLWRAILRTSANSCLQSWRRTIV